LLYLAEVTRRKRLDRGIADKMLICGPTSLGLDLARSSATEREAKTRKYDRFLKI
jgi:hypothetical protein